MISYTVLFLFLFHRKFLEVFNFIAWCGIFHNSIAMEPLKSSFQTLICLQITWRSYKYADPDLVGFGWSLRFCISNKFQVTLLLLVPGLHFESQDPQLPLP